jgi:hypothetical protein
MQEDVAAYSKVPIQQVTEMVIKTIKNLRTESPYMGFEQCST